MHPTLRHRPLDLRLRHVFRIARGASDVRYNLLVEAEAEGRVGIGEAAPILRYGEDRASAARAVAEMAARLGDARAFAVAARRAAVAGQASAEAALDMALHDLAGQRLQAPLFELLGLDPSDTPQTSFTIGMDTPDVVVEKVRQAADYPILKVKMGSDDDRAVLEAVRDTTDRTLRVDANEGWTPAGALERLEWLARLGVEFVEQPLPAAMIAETLRMIAVARAHGLKIMLGCMIESSVAITAAAHLSPLVDTADLDGNLLLESDPYVGATVVAGRIVLPEGPGLGVRARG